MTTDHKRCESTRKDGQPCTARALPEGTQCFAHAPQLESKRNAARQRGGHGSAKVVRMRKLLPPRLSDVFDRLEQALDDVLDGKISPRKAAAAAAVARAMVTVYTAGQHEEEIRQLEEQIRRARGEAS